MNCPFRFRIQNQINGELWFKVNEGWKEMLNHVNYLTILLLSIWKIDGIPLMEARERMVILGMVLGRPFAISGKWE